MAGFTKRVVAALMAMTMIIPILAACGGGAAQPQVIRETVVVVQTAEPVRETVVETVVVTEEVAAEQYTTPHPILSDVRVRQAIAYCTNRPELIASVYPFLTPEQQQNLLMDTFLPKAHWAAAKENITVYPFDPEKGKALLEEAGWTGEPIRSNANGEPLSLSFTTTNAQFRQTWSAVFIRQMAACGIQIIPTYAPASWWFGSSTGLSRRDFELGAFAWVGQADPGGQTLYACNQIPLPSNNWEGQNYMGWCNERASRAIIAANNTLDRAERIRQYAIVQEEFTKDMVSLPLFNRLEAYAASNRLLNFKPNPTEYYTANADEWELTDGGDTLVLGFTQEPQTMWSLIESAAVQRVAVNLLGVPAATTYDYDYQPVGLDGLSTIESGRATNVDIEVKEGDIVWNTDGEAVPLAPGVEIVNAAGETITYQGGTVTMKQLTVTDKWISGITWEDGEPLKKADFELAYKINCDPESGVVSLTYCNSIAKIDFTSDTEYTVTFHPGVQWPTYFAGAGLGAYPSHQVLSDGRRLADVPAAEWQTLPEIIERPLSNGPYVLKEWVKGQSMTFEANPNYYKGEVKIKNVIIKFIADTNQAVAQLLTGEVDVLGSETLGAGAEVQTVIEAGNRGEIQAFVVASPTWEHIDMNLFTK
ncbi:MAG TPA: peptide ABC transporter substrate-binding protein [Chloroflexus aurantiacus]|uniref:ABC-type dipeptide transport system periplasmic component-like protein n=1 Tax=Chloroflexus aurantiacus (strain ATCC 29366 / DSM 635 / J-10-fl) TaxID=324602 RepID=A9WBN5_CHLAA|nr:ABC transporter substrate-binding protein [Chloroflexus aurantiacus]ABY34842.1 ABC-type dipeptide transport system periplasmic component-like protein [Chloroflexus aurantiacus J-10-fl]HBW67743.1 peptide ABC transporter substrate-binding protein [Chloroflexus aurantiacus]